MMSRFQKQSLGVQFDQEFMEKTSETSICKLIRVDCILLREEKFNDRQSNILNVKLGKLWNNYSVSGWAWAVRGGT